MLWGAASRFVAGEAVRVARQHCTFLVVVTMQEGGAVGPVLSINR
jgi:hypothetical protein